jgi:hypothetical protein
MPENLTELLRQEVNRLDLRIQEFTQRKQAILNLLKTYQNRGNDAALSAKLLKMPGGMPEQLSTLDMAQRIIEKHGEMKAEDIMEAIRQEFGIKPAHTLPQMLYIRARAKKRFYRTNEGRFGVVTSGKRKQHTKRSAA